MRTFILPFIIAVINFSCSSPEAVAPTRSPKTEKFSNYLRENFDDSIPSGPHLYFLVAEKNTHEKIIAILSRLKSELKSVPKNRYSMIFSVNVPVADSLIPKENSRTDWDNSIEKLGFNLSGVAVIQTRDHNIIDMLQLSAEASGMEKKFLEWE